MGLIVRRIGVASDRGAPDYGGWARCSGLCGFQAE